jgi:hypothetical protein
MGTTWPRWVGMAVVLLAMSRSTTAEPAVLLGFISNDTRMMVQKAVEGATRRMLSLDCQRVFADFSLDVPAPDQFAAVRFVDDSGASQCVRGSTLAFTAPGGRVVHVCGTQFKSRFQLDPARAEIIVIHELLHVLGLGENPPTSDAITAQVTARCAP